MAIESPSAAFALPSINGTATYTYPFNNDKFEDDDVFVYLYNTSTGNYDVKTVTSDYAISGNTITFTEAPTTQVLILRRTDFNALKIPNFTPGSSIRGQDLDLNFTQLLRVNQEFRDLKVDKFFPEVRADLDMNSQRVEELAPAATDTDAVNRQQLGNVIASDITSDTTQGIQLNKTQSGSNSGDEMVITAIDSSATQKGTVIVAPGASGVVSVSYNSGTASINVNKSTPNQQGVVRIQEQNNGSNGNPVDVNYTADGEVEIGIPDNTIDVSKLKDVDIVTESEQDAKAGTNTALTDNELLTGLAISKRNDVVVQTNGVDPAAPSSGAYQTGKLQYQNVPGARVLKLWDGNQWRVVSPVGESFIPTTNTVIRYVDAVNGDDTGNNQGYLPHKPLKTIENALDLVNNDNTGDGTVIFVDSGVYKENLPLVIKKQNVSIIGRSMRSVFVMPKSDTESYKDMFHVDSGSYIAMMTLLGLKIDPSTRDGARNYSLDNDATYGLPTGQNWAVRFRTDVAPTILKSPYVQNCTHFSDAHLDIANFTPNTFPSTDAQTYSSVAGDQSSAPSAGGLLVDGSACASASPIRSMVVDAFTQITLDGPGILCTNNGYAQLVSFFGTFAHYHAKAKNGGQLNLSNCVSDFGRYGLISDGHGDTFATATASAANSGATVVTVGALSTTSGHHVTATEPLDHMMITIDGNDYGVVSSTANGSGWDVTITPALSQNISSNAVSFSLRSYISTGGHTFEYVGVGTNYGDHPDKGGKAIEANQSIELNGGKVWLSSTDHIGKFKAGTTLVVDSVSETVALKDTTITGNLTISGSVDGRQVLEDGQKLDGIEVNATADQTAAEIKTAYESNSNTECFTSADHTKLNGIAAGATVYSDSNVNTLLNTDSNSNGKVLSYNSSSSAYAWVAQSSGGSSYSDSDVNTLLDTANAQNGEVLSYNTNTNVYGWVALPTGTLTGISDDQTPQLGADLDVNGKDIVSANNGDIELAPNGTGRVVFKGNSTSGSGQLKLNCENNSHGIIIKGPAHAAAADYTLTLPTTDGGTNEFLKTDGSGNLSWAAAASGGASNINGLSDGRVISNSIGVGSSTASGSTDTALGDEDANATTHANTVFGMDAGLKIGSATVGGSTAYGHNNTVVGSGALNKLVTGFGNSIFGQRAGYNINGTNYNNAFGADALYECTTGDSNCAFGYNSLTNNTTGSGNTAVGHAAGAGASIAGVSGRTCIGKQAGYKIGEYSTYIGYQAGEDTAGRNNPNYYDVGTNNIVIGARAKTAAYNTSNQIVIGDDTNTQTLRMPGFTKGVTNGNTLVYSSASGNIEWAAPAAGDFVLVANTTLTTSAASISLTNITGYRQYKLIFALDTFNTGELFLRVGSSGTFDTGSNYLPSSPGDKYSLIGYSSYGRVKAGELLITDLSTSEMTLFYSDGIASSNHRTSVNQGFNIGGHKTQAAQDSLQIFGSNANIVGGTVSVYGLKTS